MKPSGSVSVHKQSNFSLSVETCSNIASDMIGSQSDEHGGDITPMWRDLPTPALETIFRWLDTENLLRTAGVCKRWRESVQHANSVWKRKRLSYSQRDIWEDEDIAAHKFACILNFAPSIGFLELGLLVEITPQTIYSALQLSDCKIHSLSLSIDEFNADVEAFLGKHVELSHLTVIDYCTSQEWAQNISKTISTMHQLSYLNLNSSLLLHHKGVGLGGLHLEHLEYCPEEFTQHIADPGLVLAELLHSSQKTLKTVCLRVPYREVFSALQHCNVLEDVDVMCASGISEFIQAIAAKETSSIKSLTLYALPENAYGIFRDLATLRTLETLEINSCCAFPGFSTLLPLICSLKTITLHNVKYIGSTELKDLISITSNLKIILIDCPCSESGHYRLCRDRILIEVAKRGIDLTVYSHGPMNDMYDVGFNPAYDCSCDHRKPPRR